MTVSTGMESDMQEPQLGQGRSRWHVIMGEQGSSTYMEKSGLGGEMQNGRDGVPQKRPQPSLGLQGKTLLQTGRLRPLLLFLHKHRLHQTSPEGLHPFHQNCPNYMQQGLGACSPPCVRQTQAEGEGNKRQVVAGRGILTLYLRHNLPLGVMKVLPYSYC